MAGKHAKALAGSNLIFFRDLVRDYRLGVRFTVNQDLILTDIAEAVIPEIRQRLEDHGIPTEGDVSPLRAQSHACVGVYHTASLDFPGEIARYCPLSFTEAKLFLPQLLQDLEDAGYGDLSVPINMTGCPNSCAFSAIGGIGLWGALKRQPDGHEYFDIRIGGAMEGTAPRLALPFRQRVRDDRVAPTIKALFDLYGHERQSTRVSATFAIASGPTNSNSVCPVHVARDRENMLGSATDSASPLRERGVGVSRVRHARRSTCHTLIRKLLKVMSALWDRVGWETGIRTETCQAIIQCS